MLRLFIKNNAYFLAGLVDGLCLDEEFWASKNGIKNKYYKYGANITKILH